MRCFSRGYGLKGGSLNGDSALGVPRTNGAAIRIGFAPYDAF